MLVEMTINELHSDDDVFSQVFNAEGQYLKIQSIVFRNQAVQSWVFTPFYSTLVSFDQLNAIF